MKNLILFLAVLVGCSGADEAEPCDLAHRDGTYLLSYTERSGGTCGELPDVVGRADPDSISDGCMLTEPDDVSADQCTLTRSLVCTVQNPDGAIYGIAVTKESGGGARLEGIYTMTIRDAAGELVCLGTYDVVAVRQ